MKRMLKDWWALLREDTVRCYRRALWVPRHALVGLGVYLLILAAIAPLMCAVAAVLAGFAQLVWDRPWEGMVLLLVALPLMPLCWAWLGAMFEMVGRLNRNLYGAGETQK